MVEVLTAVAIVVNLIRPPQPYPYPQPQQYPTQRYYYDQAPQERNYPTEYQTPMGTRSWSQAGSSRYYNGQPTQTPTHQNGG